MGHGIAVLPLGARIISAGRVIVKATRERSRGRRYYGLHVSAEDEAKLEWYVASLNGLGC